MSISVSLFGLDCLGHVSKGHRLSADTMWKPFFFFWTNCFILTPLMRHCSHNHRDITFCSLIFFSLIRNTLFSLCPVLSRLNIYRLKEGKREGLDSDFLQSDFSNIHTVNNRNHWVMIRQLIVYLSKLGLKYGFKIQAILSSSNSFDLLTKGNPSRLQACK